MKKTIALLFLISNACLAQEIQRVYTPYWENFEYSINKHSATIQSKRIVLPVKYLEEIYKFRRDSIYKISINEEETEYEYLVHNNYRITCSTSYEWHEGQRFNRDVISQATMFMSFQKKIKEKKSFKKNSIAF